MTDKELIQLVRDKPPYGLSEEELSLLHGRLLQSPRLRHQLIEQYEKREYLDVALGRINTSVDALLEAKPRKRPLARFVGGVLATLFLLFVLGVTIFLLRPEWADPLLAVWQPAAIEQEVPATEEEQSAQAKPEKKQTPAVAESSTPTDKSPEADAPQQPSDTEKEPEDTKPEKVAGQKEQPPAAPEVPWVLDGPVVPFAQIALDPMPAANEINSQAQLARWFQPLGGNKRAFSEKKIYRNTYYGIQAPVQLRAPWPEQSILRFAVEELSDLSICLKQNQEMITIHYYRNRIPGWAAYRSVADKRRPTGRYVALLATDNDRWRRLPTCNRFSLHWQDGLLIMSQGERRILTVPMSAPPQQTLLDGKTLFSAVQMIRCEDIPELPTAPTEAVVRSEAPFQLDWQKNLDEQARLIDSGNGILELTAQDAKAESRIELAMPDAGLQEIVMKLEQIQPGAGVCFRDPVTGVVTCLRFLEEQQTKNIQIACSNGISGSITTSPLSEHYLQPVVAPNLWLRFVLGPLFLRCWISPDGVHWSEPFHPVRLPESAHQSQVGLYLVPGKGSRGVRLAHFEIRRLSALYAIVSQQQLASVPPWVIYEELLPAENYVQWMRNVASCCPAEISVPVWQRACALHYLRHKLHHIIGPAICSGLMHDIVTLPISLQARLDALDQLGLMSKSVREGARYYQPKIYSSLGHQILREGNLQPYTTVDRHLVEQVMDWPEERRVGIDQTLLRHELLYLAHRSRWQEIRTNLARIRFYHSPRKDDLRYIYGDLYQQSFLKWIDALAESQLPEKRRSGAPIVAAKYRHPYKPRLNRRISSMILGATASAENEDYEEACHLLIAAPIDQDRGLLQDQSSADLYLSVTEKLKRTMDAFPKLQQELIARHTEQGLLRLRYAIATNQISEVENLGIKYYGTEVANEAYRWLGNRSLEVGDFSQAIRSYRLALRSGPLIDRSSIEARLRLAMAMAGYEYGEPVSQPVSFGDRMLSVSEFESIVQQRLSEARKRSKDSSDSQKDPVPLPGVLKVQTLAKLDRAYGSRGGPDELIDLDWPSRQIACTAKDGHLYLSNRFQVSAFNLRARRRVWHYELGKREGVGLSWPLIPMKPVVEEDRIYVRQLSKEGAELTCLSRADGKLLWKTAESHQIVSDPIVLGERLLVLTSKIELESVSSLIELTFFDKRTGDRLESHSLIEVDEVAPNGQIHLERDRIVVQISGCIFLSDLSGNVLWLRKLPWVPFFMNDYQVLDWEVPFSQPPVLVAGKIYCAAPHSLSLYCIEEESGELLWQRTFPYLQEMIDVNAEQMVVLTSRAITAIDSQTGKTRWSHEGSDILSAVCRKSDGRIAFCESQKRDQPTADSYRPEIVWLEATSGKPLGRALLDDLKSRRPIYMAPLVAYDGVLYSFLGRDRRSPQREIVELTPSGDPITVREKNYHSDWSAYLYNGQSDGIQRVLSGWTFIVSYRDSHPGRVPDLLKDRDVFSTRIQSAEVMFLQHKTLPKAKKLRLDIKAGIYKGNTPKIVVRVGKEIVSEKILDSKTTKDKWAEYSVDLTPWSGKRVPVMVSHENADEDHRGSYLSWDRLDIVSEN